MLLAQHLDKLCQELAMLLPPPNRDGGYVLQFDAVFSVRFITDRGNYVLVSEALGEPIKDEASWEHIEKALQRSYGWKGLCTSLALDENERVLVQTSVDEATPYEAFFEITNAHCSICNLLLNEMRQSPYVKMDSHAYITP